MAMRLQREHSLPVVAVRLEQEGYQPVARVDLLVNEDGEQVIHGSRTVTLDELGCDSSREPAMQVPPDLVDFVGGWSHDVLAPDRALWLHLVKPYGSLGAVPWERDLVPAIGRPLLRLPDVLPAPSRSTSSFVVALVATAPAPEGAPPAPALVAPVADALVRGLGTRLHLHVFADEGTEDAVERALQPLGIARLEVHRARHDGRRTGDGDLRSAWLRWVRDAIEGRSLDAVHFLVHGTSLGTHGAVLTPLMPSLDRANPVSLEASDLEAFLNRVGALVVGFTRLPDNWSDFGLRMLADDLGSRRAGPVVLHDPALDPGHEALAGCFAFLADTAPGRPPVSPGLQLYTQPRQVADDSTSQPPPGAGSADLAPSAAVQAHFDRDDTPAWLAAAQRYLEQQEAQVMRFESESRSRTPTAAEVAHFDGVAAAVRKARGVIDKHAERTL